MVHKWLARVVAVLALVGGVALLAPAAQAAGLCPTIGNATTCNLFITINANGTVTVQNGDPDPYDGVEDTLVGVVNNFSGSIASLHLTGSNIFGFDGDGACTFLGCNNGPTKYEGPNTSFTPANLNDGLVNFLGGLAGCTANCTGLGDASTGNGGRAWFSLEEIANASNTVITIPEPGTLALLGLAATAFGFARRRKS